MKDVQNEKPLYQYEIPYVGIEDLHAYVPITWHNNHYHLLCNFSIYVNLPANQKGIHMSRIPESIYESIQNVLKMTHSSLEDLLIDIKQKLTDKHEYANSITVKASTYLPITTNTPKTNKESQEVIPVSIKLHDDKKTLVISVLGQTVCPCAQEMTKEVLGGQITPSHNQRGEMTIKFTCPIDYPITFEELYDIACKSMSAPTYSLLKRPDELSVVLQAHNNPRFVEDCVRYAKRYLDELIEHKPKADVSYTVKQVNYESIHKHNAVAIITGGFDDN